jgi:hypothetical protein
MLLVFFKFLRVGWDWVHLVRRPLFGLLYQPRMIDDECATVGGIRIGRANRSTRDTTCPNATLSTTYPTWPDLCSNPGRRGWKLATNRLGRRISFSSVVIHRLVCCYVWPYDYFFTLRICIFSFNMYIFSALMFRIYEIPGWNLDWDAGYLD